MVLTTENAEKELPGFLIRHNMSQTALSEKTGVSMKTIQRLIYGETVKRKMVFERLNKYIRRIEGEK